VCQILLEWVSGAVDIICYLSATAMWHLLVVQCSDDVSYAILLLLLLLLLYRRQMQTCWALVRVRVTMMTARQGMRTTVMMNSQQQ
jgi:hypothetical protein